MTAIFGPNCPRCHAALPSADSLSCGICGALVHADALAQLAAEAHWQEKFNPTKAIAIWEDCLKLLPRDSRQYAAIQAAIQQLRTAPPPVAIEEPGALATPKQESWPVAILKTTLSMLLSIFVYKFGNGWAWAFGFVLLILIHELGHVIANRYYGMRASPPIFIPYVGAVINLRERPANAHVEAVIGISGPVAGTIASLVTLAIYYATGNPLLLALAWIGFVMNLFNLLPVPPLDGGRVAAAVSPWLWVPGLLLAGSMVLGQFASGSGPGVLLIILILAIPRVIQTLKPSGRSGPYFAIGKVAPVVIGICYLSLAALLYSLQWYTGHILHAGSPF